MVMVGGELVEWYEIYQTHGFHLLHSSHYYEPSSPQQPSPTHSYSELSHQSYGTARHPEKTVTVHEITET